MFASSESQRAFATTNFKQAPYDHMMNSSEISQKPWKYHGYRSFSQFTASDRHLCCFRRFDAVTARIILLRQDQIVQLELELDKMDRAASDFSAADEHNGRFRDEEGSKRTKLLERIDQEMEHYRACASECCSRKGS